MSRLWRPLSALVSLWSLPASAGHLYFGKLSPQGTIIGDFVCSNGRWEQR